MTNEQAIEALQLRDRLEISGDTARLAEFMEGLGVALDVLRTLTTNGVLTLEQIRKMDDSPVYAVPTNHDPDGTGYCGAGSIGKREFMTNADWIRSLDDERLAKFICESIAEGIKDFCAEAGYPVRILNSDMRSNTRIVQRWLGEEAKA